MTTTKRLSLAEAIRTFVTDGDHIALGTAQETLIPFAAGHELIRQQKKHLTLIGPISDILFDQLIGAGAVAAVQAAWVGNVITGSGYNFRRGVESRAIAIEDHSNLTIAMALRAGALGIPFMPARTALGSSLPQTNGRLKTVICPFSGETLTAVQAIQPDVAIIHVQRADDQGNAHMWGNLGITREACLAAKKVIITAEEIVDTAVIRSDPNRVITPGFKVNAVVHVPWGAHPSPVPGYYNRDHQFFSEYQQHSRQPADFTAWRRRWIDQLANRQAYLDLVGKERLADLKIKNHAETAVADFGY